MSKVKKGAGVTAPAVRRARAATAEEAARPVTGKTGGSPRSAPTKPATVERALEGKAARKAAKAASARTKTVRPAPRTVTPKKAKPTRSTPARPRVAKAPKAKAAGSKRKATSTAKRTVGKVTAKGKRPLVTKAAVPRTVKIRELDPVQKCGPGTSVQMLYRVDEQNGGPPLAHLVFFDRHGWYCEHGRNCPAVADVRKHGKMHHLFGD